MDFIKTELDNVYVVKPTPWGDNRGWFMETYNKQDYDNAGLNYTFVQDNQSFSSEKGILRGLHFQNRPMAQAKLVRCTEGAILDVAVDIRKGSDTYLRHVAVELSAENKLQLMIPRGFAHGFVTLTDNVTVQYKVDNKYCKASDRTVKWDDSAIGIEWGIDKPVLSSKDSTARPISESDSNLTIRVLVTGAKGQLGNDLIKRLEASGYECLGVDKEDFDITDADAVINFIKNYNPYVVVHCSAYTAVDRAESDADNCYRVNVVGSKNIAAACKEINAKMVYISTDYVYDGLGDQPFEINGKTAPLSVYGKTKLDGEEECRKITDKLFVIRTSWVFGKNGNNFVKTMLKLANERDNVSVVNDQIGSPTYTVDLADFIFYILNTTQYGIYHCSNEGFCSWYDFAKEIFALTDADVKLNETKTSDYKTAAVRPLNSRLNKQCLKDCGYGVMPSWKNALQRFLNEINGENK